MRSLDAAMDDEDDEDDPDEHVNTRFGSCCK